MNAPASSMRTIQNMGDEEALQGFHARAEAAIETALTAARAARELATNTDPPMRDAFEYAAAIRSLRSALTALRSAQISDEGQ